MDLYEYNLEDYIKGREEPISVNEVRELLIQLNNTFKIILKENLIHINLQPKNILISLNKLDKCLIKLSNYGSNKIINSIKENELIKNGKNLVSFDILNLGLIIYLMLFKEYPNNRIKEIELLDNNKSTEKLKTTDNAELNDLLDKMLYIEPFYRINWEMYFNHPFFFNFKRYKNEIKFPEFNIMCKIHNTIFGGYCKMCKVNLCEFCYSQHSSHSSNIVPFYQIGMDSDEKILSEDLINNIEENIKNLTKMKNDIRAIITKVKNKYNNNEIYKFDKENDFKSYYIECLMIINENSFIENNIKLLDINTWIKEYEKVYIQF